MGAFDKILDVVGFKEYDDRDDDMNYDVVEDDFYYENETTSNQRATNRNAFGGMRSLLPSEKPRYEKDVDEDMRIILLQPIRFEEAQSIAHNLLENKVVVFDLQECDIDEAVNIVNFVSGAVYAMDGSIQKINERGAIFLAVPPSVEMENDMNTAFSEDSYGPTIAEWVNRTRGKEDF